MTFVRFDGGMPTIGHQGDGFCFDNECPAHRVLLQPFELADRLVTCGEYLAFVDAGGYEQPEHWLSMGWDAIQAGAWRHPLYWRRKVQAGQEGQAPRKRSGGSGGA
jgi:formylglycine-generating enzyme required for sulfatase activity